MGRRYCKSGVHLSSDNKKAPHFCEAYLNKYGGYLLSPPAGGCNTIGHEGLIRQLAIVMGRRYCKSGVHLSQADT
jgi:hypothetical protein